MSIFKTNEIQKVRLYEIATLMKQSGLEERFIASAVEVGLYYEGVFDLFELWANEKGQIERDLILADIQYEITEYKKLNSMDTK